MSEQGLSPVRLPGATAVGARSESEVLAQPRRSTGFLGDAYRRLKRNRTAMAGLVVVILIALSAVLAPLLAPYDPIKVYTREALQPPGPIHLFGTDLFGRDIFSRVLWGGRLSLLIGLISVGIACTTGIVLGLLSGYYAGLLGALIMRFIDMLLAFPGILLALAVVSILGPSLQNVMIAVGVANIPHYTRVVRASVLALKNNVYVDAARVVGCTDRRIMFIHILPNTFASLIVMATLGIPGAILSGAALSFLGLGVQPPTSEWGAMVSSGRDQLRNSWWISTFPGVAIMFTVMAINLLGDGLREAMDPRLRKR